MKDLPINHYLGRASRIGYGCMALGDVSRGSQSELIQQASAVTDACLESGINFFDHADIYNAGNAESVFGAVLRDRPQLRDSIFLQSKCGIRFKDAHGPNRYDFSREWISQSVDGILSRLSTEYLDVLLLHRPDPLAEMEAVAETLHQLHAAGKVRYFGVSNMSAAQINFLRDHLEVPLIANQIHISLSERDWIEHSIMVGDSSNSDINFADGTLEYCQRLGVQIQSWGSLSRGLYTREDDSQDPEVRATRELVRQLQDRYECSPEAIVLSFLPRHPANVQPIIGTTNVERIRNSSEAMNLELSRGDWYQLLETARGRPVP